MAHSLKCAKLALGHNQDDIIETFFLNIFFGGQISTMVPRQVLFKGALTLIRPLTLIGEREIKGLVQRRAWPEMINPCPSAGRSSRQQIKKLLREGYALNPKIRGNIFNALSNVRTDYLLPPLPRGKGGRERYLLWRLQEVPNCHLRTRPSGLSSERSEGFDFVRNFEISDLA